MVRGVARDMQFWLKTKVDDYSPENEKWVGCRADSVQITVSDRGGDLL